MAMQGKILNIAFVHRLTLMWANLEMQCGCWKSVGVEVSCLWPVVRQWLNSIVMAWALALELCTDVIAYGIRTLID